MRRALLALPAVVLLFALAGCGGDDPQPSATGQGAPVNAFSQPPRPKCADVFVPGKVIQFNAEQAAVGCLDPDGGVQIVGNRRCADGGRLYSIDGGSTGAPRGWGRDGEAYHAVKGELGADAAFRKAYDACNQ